MCNSLVSPTFVIVTIYFCEVNQAKFVLQFNMQIRNNRRDDEDHASAESSQQIWERLCSRMGNMGTYRLLQINGQRKFFDPLDDSPPTTEGCEVFIGRIPKDMFEDELVPLFALHGPIHEMRLMMNFSGLNRGFAFVMYKQPQFAEQAIRKLNNFEVRPGHHIGVIPSVNNRRLYIGRLSPSNINVSVSPEVHVVHDRFHFAIL